ncbi:hypothetical protein HPMG_01581 [Helicobacter pullorum MIT 98-5489]|uniref:Uncharacterized protein n=1 Tax=Helicobacter pullorum MIT 98-5489 TaxID=537972 RepID=C5F1H2_9HELI|nr:hypothetical protein HPMG_01581 [Helicobacter pullorum MIT 98-5489]
MVYFSIERFKKGLKPNQHLTMQEIDFSIERFKKGLKPWHFKHF